MPHPLIRLHYPARVLAYLNTGLMLLAAQLERGFDPLATALIPYCLIFPHALYLAQRRWMPDQRGERRGMYLDAINGGLGSAVLAFSLAPSLLLLITVAMNALVMSGPRYGALQLPLYALGALLGGALTGWVFVPQGGLATTGLAALGLVVYCAAIGLNAHTVNTQLRRAKSALQQQSRALEDASLTDPLTGARNRRFLSRRLEAVDSAARGEPFAFLLLDVDRFKAINDGHGHEAGDAVLQQLADRLRGLFPAPQEIVRWGGEEFLVLLQRQSPEQLPGLLERTADVVRGEPFALPRGERLRVTISAGAAPFPFPLAEGALGWDRTVDLADRALYAAKHGGRDTWRVVLPGASPLPAERVGEGLESLAAAGLIELARPRTPSR